MSLEIIKEEYPEVYSDLKNKMYSLIGFGLSKEIMDLFGKEKSVSWFYQKLQVFENRSAYDLAKDKKLSEIEEELVRIKSGNIA